jgi:hypothetical protein
MIIYLDVYCETCCALPGESCVREWVVLRDGTLITQYSIENHETRIERHKAEQHAKNRLLLPANLVPPPNEPRCPGCGGTYEEHAVDDCFESFGRPLPPDQ